MGSWSNSTYSFSQNPGYVDFYGSQAETASSLIQAVVSTSVNITKTTFASASLSGDVGLSAVARRVVTGDPSFEGDVATFVLSVEILKGEVFVDGQVSVSVSATKFAYASSALSFDSDVVVVTKEFLKADSSIVISSSLSSSSLKIAKSSSLLSSDSSVSVSSVRLATIDLSLSSSASLSVPSLAIRLAVADVDGCDVDVQTTAIGLLGASSSINSDSELSVSLTAIAHASGAVSGVSESTGVIRKIVLASSAMDQTAVLVAVSKEVLNADINIAITSRVIWAGFTCFNVSRVGEDVSTPRTLLVIDSLPLSEHNRKMTSGVIRSFVENRNWSASRSRYYKGSTGRRSFSINWTLLPGDRGDTADLRFGRDKIQSIASDPDIHQLKLLEFDTDGESPYSESSYEVIVTRYSENLVRRDIPNGVYLWDCSLELEEV